MLEGFQCREKKLCSVRCAHKHRFQREDENIQKLLHKLFVLHLFFSYLCIVDKGMIFAPWAARKIFLAGEEYFLRETAK